MPLQPAFLGYLPSTDLNVTGAGATYTLGGVTALTEVFDVGGNFTTAGVFTAPVTGKYFLTLSIYVTGCTIATSFSSRIITSNGTYLHQTTRAASALDYQSLRSISADMDVGDTASCTMIASGEAGDTDDILGSATGFRTSFGGFLQS